jgi:CubicO group peptidase (beta-lactamase class C family)
MGDLMNEIEASALRDGVAYADRWLEYRREFRDHPGLVAAVQHADDLLLLKGYGYAQLEDCVPMAPNHIFRIAPVALSRHHHPPTAQPCERDHP